VSRILLSVLLFAGAFTSLLDGRLGSVFILAQNLKAGWVLIKRFPLLALLASGDCKPNKVIPANPAPSLAVRPQLPFGQPDFHGLDLV
jgi:hypothetical protein